MTMIAMNKRFTLLETINRRQKTMVSLTGFKLISLAFIVIGLFLLILALVLSSCSAKLTKDNLKNLTTLNQVLPGFNVQTLGKLKQELSQLEEHLLALAYLFDPPEKGMRKDYDLSIYFVDELSKTNQFLKLKAINKGMSYPDLGFKETLPDEKEARYLLRQLYALKEVVSRGMDCGINFISITPQPIEDLGILADIKSAKTRIEFTAQAPALIEFIIQVSELVPLDSFESILLKSQDSTFKADMTLSYTVIDTDWKTQERHFTPLNIREVFGSQEKFINMLRANNPLSVAVPAETQEELSVQAGGQPKKLSRFLYRGKAVLRTKEVAVIEDTLNQETVFLALQEKFGDFILKELQDFQIILKNINTDQEIIIKREGE